MRALLASPLGLLIGMSLGALGGGGSILAVPALVYAAGQTPGHATTTSLVLVAITAVIGIVPHWRSGRVRAGAGALFGLAGIGGSLVGSRWNEAADPDALLLGFSGLMLVAAAAMWRRARRTPSGSLRPTPRVAVRSVGAAANHAGATHVPAIVATGIKVALAGTGVGLLTGFFGVGGGFVIVPALVLALDFTMPEAVGTSLLVITINSLVALSSRLQTGAIEWRTVVPFTLASVVGVALGTRLAGRKDPMLLQRWFVRLLVTVAVYTAVRSTLALG